jgi:hypothetical protein
LPFWGIRAEETTNIFTTFRKSPLQAARGIESILHINFDESSWFFRHLSVLYKETTEEIMPVIRATTKKSAKPAATKPAKKAVSKAVKKEVTLADLKAIVADIGRAHKENMDGFKESRRSIEEMRLGHKDLEQAHKEAMAELRESRRMVDDLGSSHKEAMAELRESRRIVDDLGSSHKETMIALKETQRIVGDLGNKFGDEAEYTLIPGLPEKFKQFGFSFGSISRNKKIRNREYDIHADVDAFLENGTQAMAVEVKAKLHNDDVDKHIKRMEKLRKYADIFGDRRELYGALAATVVEEKQRNYALENGFYVIEPSGEDITVIQPDSNPRVW